MINLIKKENLYTIDNQLNIYYIFIDKVIYIKIEEITKIDNLKMNKIIDLFTNEFIKQYKPIKIIIFDTLSYKKQFYNNMYYEKSNYFIRIIEKIRNLIDENSFDNSGYIINQGLINDVRFGLFKTNQNGCGWIACYNLLKILNKQQTITKTIKDLSKPYLLAVNIFTLFAYLRNKNVDAYLTPIFKKQCIRDIKNSKCGIILYIHKSGSHYVAYEKVNDNNILLYNAVYGIKNHIINIEEFYKKYTITPLGMLIFVK